MKSIKLGVVVDCGDCTLLIEDFTEKSYTLSVTVRDRRETACLSKRNCHNYGIVRAIKMAAAMAKKDRNFPLSARLRELAVLVHIAVS